MKKGQIFTPKNIVNFMIDLSINTNKDKKVLEPSFGKGIFLESLLEKGYKNIDAIELDKNLYKEIKNKEINLYNQNYLSEINQNKYNLIIGNPPYTQNNKIDIDTINLIKENNILIDNGEWDLYYYFIEKSIKELQDNGELIFLIPITFLNNTYAKSLRDYIYDNGFIESIYSFEEEKIFGKEADLEVIIFHFIKSKKIKDNKKINISIINKSSFSKDKDITNDMFNTYKITYFKKDDFFWNIYNQNINKYSYKRDINEIFDIYVGMVSGYDKAFLIKDEDFNKLNKKEKQFIKVFIKANTRRNLDNIKNYIFIDKNYFKNEEELKNNLPNIYNLLLEYKDELLNRYKGNKINYWEWATIRNLDLYNNIEDKFFIPTISRDLKESFTRYQGVAYGGGDIVCISFKNGISSKEKSKYITLLNSKDFINYINDIVPKKGGRKLFTQKFITTLNI